MIGIHCIFDVWRTVGQRDSSSCSSCRTKLRRKRRRYTDASTSSSTTCIVPKDMSVPDSDNDRVYLAEDNETDEEHESRRQPRGPHRGSCLRDSSIPHRHPSRFISQRPAKTHKIADSSTVLDVDGSLCEGDDELELHLSSTFPTKPAADPRITSLRRTLKEQRLRSRARRTTGAEVPYDEQDEGSFKAMHGLGFKDEQVLSVIGKHQVVVTVDVHEPRHVCKANVGESPNSPPVVPPSTRDLPEPEFVEDLQPSHSFEARLSDSLISTTGSLASAELLYVDTAAVHCEAGQVTPEEDASKKGPTFAKRFLSDDKPVNTAHVQGFRNPLKNSSTRHSSIAEKKLDTATIDILAKGASWTDPSIAGMTVDVAKTSSDVTSTCVIPYRKSLVSFTKMKATSTDSDDTSLETARALLVFSDSNEGTIPPSRSMSISFVSSSSSSDPAHRVTDLAHLPSLQNNVSAANNDTGDGSVVLNLPRLISSATQTDSSRLQASSLTERGTQAQELPEWPCHSGWPHLLKAPRSDIGPRGTTDRPWTEDIRNVVMQGNKNYLHQHARRRYLAKSATNLDETQCVLFKLDEELQPDATSSSVAPEIIWTTSMSSEFTREGCVSTQELRRDTVSSARDVRTVASDSTFEQPLKLTQLILLQHPEVGLRGFFPINLPGATNAQDGGERHGISLDPNTVLEPALELNSVLEDSAAGLIGEKTCTTNPSLKVADRECQLEPKGEDRKKDTAEPAVGRVTESNVPVPAPQNSQPVIFLPNCSVAIRLPGGSIRTVHQGQPAFSCASPQIRAVIRLGQRSRQVVPATAQDQPTFESVYNSILQPPPKKLFCSVNVGGALLLEEDDEDRVRSKHEQSGVAGRRIYDVAFSYVCSPRSQNSQRRREPHLDNTASRTSFEGTALMLRRKMDRDMARGVEKPLDDSAKPQLRLAQLATKVSSTQGNTRVRASWRVNVDTENVWQTSASDTVYPRLLEPPKERIPCGQLSQGTAVEKVTTALCAMWPINVDKALECRQFTTDTLLLPSLLLMLLLEESMPLERQSQGGKDDKVDIPMNTNIRDRGTSSGTLNGIQEWQLCISIVIFPPVLLLLQERVRWISRSSCWSLGNRASARRGGRSHEASVSFNDGAFQSRLWNAKQCWNAMENARCKQLEYS
ncbi:hypothetical protein HPB50_028124 [Hyalomma asiaticum]|nr:hypothetical protein HPB50_028124 [Hyalomma asiaticum]